jgi:hypothetical protein
MMIQLLGRDKSSHNLTVAYSCGHGTPMGSGPQTHRSRSLGVIDYNSKNNYVKVKSLSNLFGPIVFHGSNSKDFSNQIKIWESTNRFMSFMIMYM